jgi:hypothetical protein
MRGMPPPTSNGMSCRPKRTLMLAASRCSELCIALLPDLTHSSPTESAGWRSIYLSWRRSTCERTVVHCRRDLWRQDLKASIFYRIAAILLLLFVIPHTLGFRQIVPEWGVASVIGSMRSIHFDAQGFNRTYWDFFSAFGLFFSVFLLFAAVLAWQLGRVPAGTFAPFMRTTAWTLAISFAAVTALSWRYSFTTPIVFSTLITVCLVAGAWLSAKSS